MYDLFRGMSDHIPSMIKGRLDAINYLRKKRLMSMRTDNLMCMSAYADTVKSMIRLELIRREDNATTKSRHDK